MNKAGIAFTVVVASLVVFMLPWPSVKKDRERPAVVQEHGLEDGAIQFLADRFAPERGQLTRAMKQATPGMPITERQIEEALAVNRSLPTINAVSIVARRDGATEKDPVVMRFLLKRTASIWSFFRTLWS